MSLLLLSIKAANMLIMGKCCSTVLGLYRMQHSRLLTLCWRSVDAQLILCWCSVDALLTLCWCSVDAHCQVQQHRHSRYCLYMRPILRLWVNAKALALDYTRWHTLICWCSVDALLTLCWRSFSGEVNSRYTILPTKAANTSIMRKSHGIALRLFMMEQPKSLTFHSRSF